MFDRTVVVSRARWELVLPDGHALEIAGDDTIVGRKPQAPEGVSTLLIADPTRTLSKSHARLRRVGESWTVEDLGSTNGLLLITDSGAERPLEPGVQAAATERMVLGTLEVTLRRVD